MLLFLSCQCLDIQHRQCGVCVCIYSLTVLVIFLYFFTEVCNYKCSRYSVGVIFIYTSHLNFGSQNGLRKDINTIVYQSNSFRLCCEPRQSWTSLLWIMKDFFGLDSWRRGVAACCNVSTWFKTLQITLKWTVMRIINPWAALPCPSLLNGLVLLSSSEQLWQRRKWQ